MSMNKRLAKTEEEKHYTLDSKKNYIKHVCFHKTVFRVVG